MLTHTAAECSTMSRKRKVRGTDKNYSLCLFLRGKLAKRVSRWFLLEIFPPMTYAYGKENKNGKP